MLSIRLEKIICLQQFISPILSSTFAPALLCTQQDDPLELLMFCASSLELAESMKAKFYARYLDDGGDAETLVSGQETIRNDHKCEMVSDNNSVEARS
jgi:hypothetical protein